MWPTTSLNCRQASRSELGAYPRIDPAGQKELALPECRESLDTRCGARCCPIHENWLLPSYRPLPRRRREFLSQRNERVAFEELSPSE
jgi:hypothetical protein